MNDGRDDDVKPYNDDANVTLYILSTRPTRPALARTTHTQFFSAVVVVNVFYMLQNRRAGLPKPDVLFVRLRWQAKGEAVEYNTRNTQNSNRRRRRRRHQRRSRV